MSPLFPGKMQNKARDVVDQLVILGGPFSKEVLHNPCYSDNQKAYLMTKSRKHEQIHENGTENS